MAVILILISNIILIEILLTRLLDYTRVTDERMALNNLGYCDETSRVTQHHTSNP
jgi:hypothetical protein